MGWAGAGCVSGAQHRAKIRGCERGAPLGPVAKFDNGRDVGWTGPHFTTATRGRLSLKTEPTRPLLRLLTKFATGPSARPACIWPRRSTERASAFEPEGCRFEPCRG